MNASVTLTVNGQRHQHEVDARLLLVHFLRDVLGLTGTKVGCDTSQCGSCTVLVDGVAVKSCTCLAAQADGCVGHHHRRPGGRRRAAPDPGSVLGQARAAVRLLHAGHGLRHARTAAHATPSRRADEIRHGARGQPVPLHRLPEHRARRAVRRPRRWEARHEHAASSAPASAAAKTRGCSPASATFTDDLSLPGMVHAAMLRSPHAHARIARIDTAKAATAPGVLAVYHRQGHRRGRSSRCRAPWLLPNVRPQGRRLSGAGDATRCATSATSSPSSWPRRAYQALRRARSHRGGVRDRCRRSSIPQKSASGSGRAAAARAARRATRRSTGRSPAATSTPRSRRRRVVVRTASSSSA